MAEDALFDLVHMELVSRITKPDSDGTDKTPVYINIRIIAFTYFTETNAVFNVLSCKMMPFLSWNILDTQLATVSLKGTV